MLIRKRGHENCRLPNSRPFRHINRELELRSIEYTSTLTASIVVKVDSYAIGGICEEFCSLIVLVTVTFIEIS